LGRGLAASGGCPELFEVEVRDVERHLDWLTCEPSASLTVPSVRNLHIIGACSTEEEALLLCCGLVQMGYKHRFYAPLADPENLLFPPSVIACLRAIVCGCGMNVEVL
jgi:hypothetical protein